MWGGVQYLLGLVTFALLVKVILKKRHNNARLPAAQELPPAYKVREPGSEGAPLYEGLRVVELATVVAAPSIGRLFAEMGAQVVKVEEPNGDYWRRFFLQFEQPRTFSSSFECMNLNKLSVQINLKKSSGRSQFFKLLEQADVLITNVRKDGLERLGLDYEQIKTRFPHLIYAHLSAYGRSGPHYSWPGYDLGAFWAGTGMTARILKPGFYSRYPVGFGDCATGATLMAGINFALAERIRTGHGQFVDTALCRVGLWCLSPDLVKITDSKSKISEFPKYETAPDPTDPALSTYRSKDGRFFVVLGSGKEGEYHEKLRKVFNIRQTSDSDLKATVSKEVNSLTFAEVSQKLSAARVDICPMPLKEELESYDFDNFEKAADPFIRTECVPDISHFVRIPIDTSISKANREPRRAPEKGAHTDYIVKHGWSERHPAAAIKRADSFAAPESPALHGVVVVEISEPEGSSVTAASTTMMMADLGAQVIKIERRGGDAFRSRDPPLFAQLNRGKRCVEIDIGSPSSAQASIHAILARANVIVTDARQEILSSIGISYEQVSSKFPELVYCLITPWGKTGGDDRRGDMGAWYYRTGFASVFCGVGDTAPMPMPPHLGDFITSCYSLAAVGSGLFHQRRTGKGLLVDVNLVRVSMWCMATGVAIVTKDHTKASLFQLTDEEFHRVFPVPTANCFRTKDGMWVQLLGVELPRHLHKTLKCFGIALPTYLRLVKSLVTEVIPSKEKTRLERIGPILNVLNSAIRAGVGRLTWRECASLMDKRDVWYTQVRMPENAVRCDQFIQTNSFVMRESDDGVFIRTPVKMSSCEGIVHVPNAVESVGASNHVFFS